MSLAEFLADGWLADGWRYLGGGVAFLAMLAFTPLVIRLAHRLDWLAYPQADRWHAEPTALMGGLALFAAATLGALLSAPAAALYAVWGGATIMFLVGLFDDLRQIRPAAKLVAQVVATGLLLYFGYAFGYGWPVWISLPLTFLWVVGITNAINLLDNMDGLAAGVAGIAAGVLAVFAGLTGSLVGASLGAVVAGACAGFLVFNFKPARIFMGDCGSLFLGFTIAALALDVQRHVGSSDPLAPYLVPVAVLAVPIFDTTLVTFVRKLAGRPVSQGGRDHSSHRLVFLGLSERHAVLMLYALSLVSGALALFFLAADVKLFYAATAFVGVGLVMLGVHLARADVYPEPGGGDGQLAPDPPASRLLRLAHAVFGRRWRVALGLAADVTLVAAALVVAYYLRFEGGLTPAREAFLVETLPLVITVKVAVFYGLGLYRGLWRHAGTPELVRVVAATTLASGAAFLVLVLVYGTAPVSHAIFFIDWMVSVLAVGGVRFGFRGLRQYMAASRRHGRRVLLYGAGDTGIFTLRMLRQAPDLDLAPVGFLDDDPAKQGCTVQGLRVLGTADDLADVCAAYDAAEVLITSLSMPATRRRELRAACDAAGVRCRAFGLTFEPMQPNLTGRPRLSA